MSASPAAADSTSVALRTRAGQSPPAASAIAHSGSHASATRSPTGMSGVAWISLSIREWTQAHS